MPRKPIITYCCLSVACLLLALPVMVRGDWEYVSIPDIPAVPYTGGQTGEVVLAETPTEGTTSNLYETALTPDLVALASALQHDPLTIYEYVKNRIDYTPTYGIQNGAYGCYLAGRGNAWDQNALLVALLRESGYPCRFAYGGTFYYRSDLVDWVPVSSSQMDTYLRRGGGYVGDVTGQTNMIFGYRLWSEVKVDNEWYRLDPAIKTYRDDTIDIESAAGYSITKLRATALQGATVGSADVDDLNWEGVTNALAGYTANLLAHIREHEVASSVDEIFGLRRLVPKTVTNLSANLPYIYWVDEANVVYSDHIAATNHLTFRVRHEGIDETFKGYELAGKCLSMRYDAQNRPVLRLDDTVMATGNATTTNDPYALLLDIYFPVDSHFTTLNLDQSTTQSIISGGTYVILHSHGNAGGQTLKAAAKRVQMADQDGDNDAKRTAVLNQMVEMYNYQDMCNQELHSVPLSVRRLVLYKHGVAGDAGSGIYVDLPGSLSAVVSALGDDSGLERDGFIAGSLAGSALEHGVIEQCQKQESVSTVRLLALNVENGSRTFLANTGTWSYVKTQIQGGYSASRITAIESSIINQDMTYILPSTEYLSLNQWTGIGYVQIYSDSSTVAMRIQGGLNGGRGTTGASTDSTIATEVTSPGMGLGGDISDTLAADPVSLVSGSQVFNRTDLAVGAGDGVRGLAISRHYRSDSAASPGTLGRGWSHSYESRARQTTRLENGLGGRSPADVAAQVVQNMVIADLMTDDRDVVDWAMAAIVAKWGMDQLTGNSVTVELGNRTLDYTRQPDGSYTPPPGINANLVTTNGQYRLLERFGKEYRFNTNGLLASVVDADSNTLDLSYNAQDQLQSVADATSRALTFTYTGDKLTQVSDGTGRSLGYGYTGDDLTSYTDPDGKVWTYQYDTNHQMTVIRDPLNQTIVSNIYNQAGQVVTQYNGQGETWIFHCSDFMGTEIDPLGNATTHYFDRSGRNLGTKDALGNRTYNSYDGRGLLVTNLDANGNTTVLQYDADHNLTNRIDALGNEWSYQYDSQQHLVATTDPLGATTRYVYDSEHHLTAVSNALDGVTIMTYTTDGLPDTVTDANSSQTAYTYDSYDQPQTISRTDGGTVTNTWNVCGELIVARDALGNDSTYTYNKRGLLTSLTDADGNVLSNVYNDAGLKTQTIDKRGNTTVLSYTPSYEISTIHYPDGGTVSNTYDAANRLVAVTDAETNMTAIIRDAAGRTIATSNSLGHVVSYALDPNGSLLAMTNALGHVTRYERDALGRSTNTWDQVDTQIRADVSEFDDVGRVAAVVNPLSQRTEYTRDPLGRVTTMTRPDQADEHNAYDALGNLLSYTNAKNVAVVQTAYDGQSRPVTQTNALGNGKSWTYDNAGNQLTRTDANGDTTEYSFDRMNRIDGIEYPDNSMVGFAYDEAGNLLAATNADAAVSFGYDSMNRVSAVTSSVLSVSSVVNYSHDKNGNRTSLTLPGNKTITYTYDEANRLSEIDLSTFSVSSVFSVVYDAAGNPTNIVYPNGVTAAYTYDEGGRLTGLTYNKSGSAFIDRAYTYNALGQIAKRTITAGLEAVPPDTHQYRQHNAADQLTHVSRMDNYENPERWRDVGPDYDARGAVTNITVAYNGMTLDNVFSWDYEGRLTAYSGEHQTNLWFVAPPIPQSLSFKYDALGGRVSRSRGGSEKVHVLDQAAPLKNVLVQRAADGTIERYYIYAPGFGLVAHIDADGTARYYHGDHLGSTIALTDASGNVTDEFNYTPYGELMARTGSTDTPYTFCGRHGVYWEGGNLYHMKARYYRADLARFISPDPLGIQGGVNLYAYANGDPIRFFDALGLCAESTRTREVSIGWRGTVILGIGVEVGVAFDTDNNVGPVLRFYGGTGVEVPITGIFPGVNYTETQGNIYEQGGWGSAAKIQVIGGPSIDIDSTEANGADVGAIGGGAYKTWTVVPVSPEEQRETNQRFERDIRNIQTTEGQLRALRRLSGGW